MFLHSKIKRLFLLLLILLTSLVINSCKKENQSSSIQTLFTAGTWQLASVMAFNYVGSTLVSTDTLNTNCNLIQTFKFTKTTCTYTNFDCVTQPAATGQWSLAQNQLYLQTNVVCKDTTAAGSSKPFLNAAIINLGQFSMVLNTGDIQPNYSLTAKRRIVQYGFINQNSLGTSQ
jgi:hypothetical protein